MRTHRVSCMSCGVLYFDFVLNRVIILPISIHAFACKSVRADKGDHPCNSTFQQINSSTIPYIILWGSTSIVTERLFVLYLFNSEYCCFLRKSAEIFLPGSFISTW